MFAFPVGVVPGLCIAGREGEGCRDPMDGFLFCPGDRWRGRQALSFQFTEGLPIDKQLKIVDPQLAFTGIEGAEIDGFGVFRIRDGDGIFLPSGSSVKVEFFHVVHRSLVLRIGYL